MYEEHQLAIQCIIVEKFDIHEYSSMNTIIIADVGVGHL